MDFVEMRQAVFSAYAHGDFQLGLAAIEASRSEFSDRDEILTFWEACLSSMAGEPERALGALSTGLDRGLAWHPKMLADPDLDAARELEGWDELVQRSARALDILETERPETLSRISADPLGTLIALHGGGEVPGDVFSHWATAMPEEWSLIVPAGDVPRSGGRWAWPYDLSTDSLVTALSGQPLHDPLVLAGYSQGAALALKAAWNEILPLTGLILIAGMLGVDEWRRSARKRVPLFLVVGTDDDISFEPSKATCQALDESGVPVHVDIREGLGHEYPPDLDRVIANGLAWISEQTARRDAGTGP